LFAKKTGVDVMITIFCDFCQFWRKNGVFLKKQCYDQIFAKVAVEKNANFFARFFGENI
jgi:hypothetical protein